MDLVLVHHAELDDSMTHLLRHCGHRTADYAEMLRLHPPSPSPLNGGSFPL
ncbi:hypothetical protein [Streptomyces globisporus]|uniref:hypothetical protein n=1 Tax=Streptomyces globisporus TaxID=1908 RepID=UPI000A7BFA76|nr:hypothetical protein [Streptomyces globisporus]